MTKVAQGSSDSDDACQTWNLGLGFRGAGCVVIGWRDSGKMNCPKQWRIAFKDSSLTLRVLAMSGAGCHVRVIECPSQADKAAGTSTLKVVRRCYHLVVN
jgi:hypothetical protein